MSPLLSLRTHIRSVTFAALAALILLNGADIVTTHLVLSRGAVEADPLSKFLLTSRSLLWVKLGILGLLGVKVLNGRPRLGVMGAACFAAGIYATAVLSNLLLLRLLEAR